MSGERPIWPNPSPPKARRPVRRKISSARAKNGVFQHNRLSTDLRRADHEGPICDELPFPARRMNSHNADEAANHSTGRSNFSKLFIAD
jgi:hypothetical protein